MSAPDPYRYFRIEAQELLEGLAQGVVELVRGAAAAEVAPRLLRFAHTLKGAARVVQLPALAALAHEIEDQLVPRRAQPQPLLREELAALQATLDRLAAQLAPITAPAASAPAAERGPAPQATPEPSLDSVRVAIADLDGLLEHVCELGGAAARLAGALGEARLHAEPLAALERELDALRERIERMRLVPAQVLFTELERVTLETAARTGKAVVFEGEGGDIRLDAHVLRVLRGALLHVVSNCVAHGIESAAERSARGKPARGRVTLRLEQHGHRIRLVCEDDGGGIAEDAVRRALVRQGRLGAEQAERLDCEQLAAELLRGGVTTCETATAVAGRGVGLDVVRDAVQQLKGQAALRGRPQGGTALELWVPISLASLPALGVDAGPVRALLPLDAVAAAVRVGPGAVERTAGGETLTVGGQTLPFLPLAELLDPAGARGLPQVPVAVIVQARGRRAALGVLRLGEVERIVLRKLPALARESPVVAGAAFDRRGTPQLVLSPEALLDAALRREAPAAAPAPPRRAPVLVIDDSLTTRMLEQSILESAGYEVELAVSALEALQKAAQRAYSVFVVDIEMPGMDGFEFVARTRADPRLREIPAIIVSSLADPGQLRRGKEVGARAYIAKGEFDQGVLLDAIRRLIG